MKFTRPTVRVTLFYSWVCLHYTFAVRSLILRCWTGSYMTILSKSNYRVRLNVNMNIADSISFYFNFGKGCSFYRRVLEEYQQPCRKNFQHLKLFCFHFPFLSLFLFLFLLHFSLFSFFFPSYDRSFSFRYGVRTLKEKNWHQTVLERIPWSTVYLMSIWHLSFKNDTRVLALDERRLFVI